MNLYKISQDVNSGYDTYDSAPEVIEDGEPPKWPWVVGATSPSLHPLRFF